MKHQFLAVLAVAAAFVLASCGGGGDAPTPVQVASADANLPANGTITAALSGTTFAFPTGVPGLGTTGTTTLAFSGTAAAPGFSIASGGNTAGGALRFGSCIFAVSSSTFPAGHPMALGQTVTVNPCNINLNTTGVVANGVAVNRSVGLVLGAAGSSGASVILGVNAGGGLTLNGNNVGTITLAFVTGGN